ncbi:hypothetical protein [Sphingomonas elodea]|uniref:hypothetical protein n=1 Tax=Sphingomonas elodea TaxID=179878 RepID=UPI0002630856|nr:hypothetical protein [Sphingomonas elodea]
MSGLRARLMRWISAIWHVRGSLPIEGSTRDPLSALEPILDERGTTRERTPDTLVFHKDNPDSQDRLASFETGSLVIDRSGDVPLLRYDLTSRPLLWCFFAPAPFAALAFAVQSMRIAGYSFSGIFLALYLAGRWIEHRQAHRLFQAKLAPEPTLQEPGGIATT